jgi:hypothetical protein
MASSTVIGTNGNAHASSPDHDVQGRRSMNSRIIIAVVTGALVVGTVAFAQTGTTSSGTSGQTMGTDSQTDTTSATPTDACT